MITISPGHWLPGTGASDLIDEVTEARKVAKRVTEILRKSAIQTNYIEDNTSKNKNENLNWLVAQHNKSSRQLDVSVHFNASSGRSNKGIGVEVLYYDAKELAANVSKAISEATGLINRGAKERKELWFLNATHKPAILLEICFVNSTVDVALYRRDFEKICQAIAKVLAKYVGKPIKDSSTVKEVTNEVSQEFLNVTGRNECKQLIARGVEEKLFTSKHEDVDNYTDTELISYAMAYVNRKLKQTSK